MSKDGIDKSWRPLGNISPHLIRAAMAGEDARFCRHHGFDWGAIETAWDRYQSGHGRLLGASTISMQTAKNVFLWPGRDWLRKGFEAWFTALIELAWGKRRIMEIYLNVAEWGPGVYGAEAAARYYFHKPADALNPERLCVSRRRSRPARLVAAPGRRLLARGAAIRANMRAFPGRCPALRGVRRITVARRLRGQAQRNAQPKQGWGRTTGAKLARKREIARSKPL